MSLRIYFVTLLASAFLLACTTNTSKDYRLPDSPTIGLATGSITYSGALGQRAVQFENITTRKKYTVKVGVASTMNPFAKPEIDPDIETIGGLFAIELPTGQYKISSWLVTQGSWFISPTSKIDIPFSVEPGASIYLGNFHFEETSRRFLGSGSAEVTLQSKAPRDMKALAKQFTVLKDIPIKRALSDNVKLERVGGYSEQRLELTLPVFVPVR